MVDYEQEPEMAIVMCASQVPIRASGETLLSLKAVTAIG